MEDVSLNTLPLIEYKSDENNMEGEDKNDENNMEEGDCAIKEYDGQTSVSPGKKEPLPPTIGMEFESYDDAYKFYNCYAKELGFGIRVKNSRFIVRSKERCVAVLCCSCEGFKRKRESRRSRPDSRTGCPAMVRIKLMDSNRWRVIESRLEHNHPFNPASARRYKSHKKLPTDEAGILVKKSNQTEIINTVGYERLIVGTIDVRNYVDPNKKTWLKEGDSQAIYTFFCRMQLTNPNFFYLMDVDEEGFLRNVFWADARSRASYGYFNDVVLFDTRSLNNRYAAPFAPFVGVNHHGQSILFGCGLLASETEESYTWLFRAWLTCMCGRPPSVIITDHSKAVKKAVSEVLPRARHRLSLWSIMQRVSQKLSVLPGFEEMKKVLEKIVYDSVRVDEFEKAWNIMIERFGLGDHEWLKTLYEDRQIWVPVFLKDTFFAGMSTAQKNETSESFFTGSNKNTTLKEFLERYELALYNKHVRESQADFESRSSTPELKTKSPFELQLSKVYTNEIFNKFQFEVEKISSCFKPTQVHVNGPIVTYMVKERGVGEVNLKEIREYEVIYNTEESEVRCICNLFNFKGYLCRHGLSILKFIGLTGIPSQYILSRWRKDLKRIYIPNYGSDKIDTEKATLRYDHLYRRAIQFVETGAVSKEHYRVALLALEESLDKVRLVEDSNVLSENIPQILN